MHDERYRPSIEYYELLTICVVILLHALFIVLSGKGLFEANPYNTYTLQAQAWLSGRLDLGQDYPWLELAVYHQKYFVSFPPFPSYLLLPFAIISGANTPDQCIAFGVMLLGVHFAYKLSRSWDVPKQKSMIFALLLYCGSNVWQVTVDGWVWFFAQNLSLCLTLMSLFYAKKGRAGSSFCCLACAIGCRPFQILYFPLLCILLWRTQTGNLQKRLFYFLNRWYTWIPSLLVIFSYLLLNTLRFQNPFEFGHNYLPEFTDSKYGQFHFSYFSENLSHLFRFGTWSNSGAFEFYRFDGINLFFVFPMTILLLVLVTQSIFQRRSVPDLPLLLLSMVLSFVHMFFLLLHKTLGGAHFGNRYFVDAMPYFYIALLPFGTSRHGNSKFCFYTAGISFVMGLIVNFWGVLWFYGRL